MLFVDSFLIQTNNARSTPAYGDDFLCQIRSTFTIRPDSIRRLHSPHITKTFLHVLFVCTYHFSTADIRLFNGGLVPALSYYFLTQNPIFMTFDDTNPKLHHGPLPGQSLRRICSVHLELLPYICLLYTSDAADE